MCSKGPFRQHFDPGRPPRPRGAAKYRLDPFRCISVCLDPERLGGFHRTPVMMSPINEVNLPSRAISIRFVRRGSQVVPDSARTGFETCRNATCRRFVDLAWRKLHVSRPLCLCLGRGYRVSARASCRRPCSCFSRSFPWASGPLLCACDFSKHPNAYWRLHGRSFSS